MSWTCRVCHREVDVMEHGATGTDFWWTQTTVQYFAVCGSKFTNLCQQLKHRAYDQEVMGSTPSQIAIKWMGDCLWGQVNNSVFHHSRVSEWSSGLSN